VPVYLPGHAGLGLLLALPLALRRRGRPGRDPLGLTSGLLFLIVLAANLPDLVHFAELRPWTHNLAIGPALTLAMALLLRPSMGLDRLEVGAVFLAGLAHPLGDMAFGAYYPAFPFVPYPEYVGLLEWNSVEDFVAELALAAPLLLVLFHPRFSGRRVPGPWPGRDRLLVRLGLWALVLLVAANLAVLALLNFVHGYDRSPLPVAVFVVGLAAGVPFLAAAASRRADPPGVPAAYR